MMKYHSWALGCVLLTATALAQSQNAVPKNVLSGVVNGPNGPEAGVWVIAETKDLPTKFAKVVVTDDKGRYVIPEMPSAQYQVWVRGYGLVDSEKVTAKPGQKLDLKAVPAPDEKSADRKSTRLNSSHTDISRMPSSA